MGMHPPPLRGLPLTANAYMLISLFSFFKRGLNFYYELGISLRIEKAHGILRA